MNQSALIGGALIAGFVLWIAREDRLSSYARVFFGSKPDAHSSAAHGPHNSLGDAMNNVLPSHIPYVPSIGDIVNTIPPIPGFGH